MSILLLIAIAAPAAAAPLLFVAEPIARWVRRFGPWAAIPTLLLAVLPIPFDTVDLVWLLIGARFSMDPVGRVFLVTAALVWSAAGAFSSAYIPEHEKRRFLFFFLLTLTGNLGLAVSGDAVSFYFLFTLMTFAGYGLIVHSGESEAKRAGRVYLGMMVLGEGALYAALVMAVEAADSLDLDAIPVGIATSDEAGLITLLFIVGYAVKAGVVPLHMWLPLAHPIAPTPASAVLSGAMISVGVLGWLRFLPLGEVTEPGWGSIMVAFGATAAFYGVILGLVQNDAKTMLAYSSVSQMGIMTVPVGIALAEPAVAFSAVVAVTLYAAHHGIVKGALFLGAGVASAPGGSRMSRRVVLGGLVYGAVTLAGLPLTSGYVAKGQLKALSPTSEALDSMLHLFLPLSAAATMLLMVRFLTVVATAPDDSHARPFTLGLWAPWVALLAPSAFLAWRFQAQSAPQGFSFTTDLVPIALGVVTYGLLAFAFRRWAELAARPIVAPGDIIDPLERWVSAFPNLVGYIDRLADQRLIPAIASRWYRLYSESDPDDRLLRAENSLTRWNVAFFLALVIGFGIFGVFFVAVP